MTSREPRSDGSAATGILRGIVLGVVAFGVGYGIAYGMVGDSIGAEFLETIAGVNEITSELDDVGQIEPPEKWQLVGMAYFAAHNVAPEATLSTPIGDLFSTRIGLGIDSALLAIPPVVLFLAGAGAALLARGPEQSASDGFKAGVGVTIGYALLAAGGAFLFEWSVSVSDLGVSLDIAPPMMQGVLIAGVVYPLVFAGIGGALAAGLTGEGTPATPRDQQLRADERDDDGRDRLTLRQSSPREHRRSRRRRDRDSEGRAGRDDRRRGRRDRETRGRAGRDDRISDRSTAIERDTPADRKTVIKDDEPGTDPTEQETVIMDDADGDPEDKKTVIKRDDPDEDPTEQETVIMDDSDDDPEDKKTVIKRDDPEEDPTEQETVIMDDDADEDPGNQETVIMDDDADEDPGNQETVIMDDDSDDDPDDDSDTS